MKFLLVLLAGSTMGALAVGAVWQGAGPSDAGANAQTVEVRISARATPDGRIEFALQQLGNDGWGERQLAQSRYFPSGRTAPGWLNSSPYVVEYERVLHVHTSEVEGFEVTFFGKPAREEDVAILEAAVSYSVRFFRDRDSVVVSPDDSRIHILYDLDTWLEHANAEGDPVAARKSGFQQWLSAWGGDFNTRRAEGNKESLVMVYANPSLDLYSEGLGGTTLLTARSTIHHEFVHALQFNLSEGRWLSVAWDVPDWFSEGHAHMETVALLRTDPAWANWTIEEERGNAADCTAPVVHYTDAVYCAYVLGPLAVRWLADEFGMDAVWNVWRRVGARDVFVDAFRNAFGISLEQFSKRFERHRATW